MFRRALCSQCRPFSPLRLRSFPHPHLSSPTLRHFSRSTFKMDRWGPEPGEEHIALPIEQLLNSVKTRSITTQDAVERITCLAKNKSEDERGTLCVYLWNKSFEVARTCSTADSTADSTVTIADFLSQLSFQAQEDYDDYPQGDASIPGPVMIENCYGEKDRLWHEMPGMWSELDDIRERDYMLMKEGEEEEVEGAVGLEDRKAGIDRVLKDRHFISTLFLTTSPALQDLARELIRPLHSVTKQPPSYQFRHKECEVWIRAILVQLQTAGPKLKEYALGIDSDEAGPFLHWWLQWQRKFLAMATNEEVDAELRGTVEKIHDLMTIDQHLTNRWWRRWQRVLRDIVADSTADNDERIAAKRANDILATEDARTRRG